MATAADREQLIERHLPLAHRLALRYRRTPQPIDDLFQVAALGLVKAAARWDPERGVAFASYAVPTILGELRRYFRDATWDVRPPRHIQELCLTLAKVQGELQVAIGREPTIADLAERVGCSPDEVAEALQAAEGRSVGSLDIAVHEEDAESGTLGDLIGRDEREYERAEARATLARMTARLDVRAREILRLRFEDDLRQRDIAERVGLSQMHVSRILRASLETLQTDARAA